MGAVSSRSSVDACCVCVHGTIHNDDDNSLLSVIVDSAEEIELYRLLYIIIIYMSIAFFFFSIYNINDNSLPLYHIVL